MAFQNFVNLSGTSRPATEVIDAGTDGSCRFSRVLRSRKGRGGFLVTAYATTCDGCRTISSPSASFIS